MSPILIRRTNQHRPVPVREAVVVRCKTADYCALTQLSILAIHTDMGHLSQHIISQIDWSAPQLDGVIIQIPIDRRLI